MLHVAYVEAIRKDYCTNKNPAKPPGAARMGENIADFAVESGINPYGSREIWGEERSSPGNLPIALFVKYRNDDLFGTPFK